MRAGAGTRRPRLWPAIAIVALAALALLVVTLRPAPQRQDRVLSYVVIGAVTTLGLLLWLLLASRLRARVRLTAAAIVIVAGVALALSLVPAGVTGDLVPVFSWRWRSNETAPLPGPRPIGALLETRWSWPRLLGPRGDGVVDGLELARDWEVAPPREIWRRAIGPGWSSFAVASGVAVTQEQRGPQELVTAYALATGEPLWSHAEAARFEDPLGGPGPRATPAIADGTVFALGATGILVALRLTDGTPLWTRRVPEEAEASVPTYGVSASPLVLDEVVVVSAGGRSGSLVAYDRHDGRRRWSGGDDRAAYSSPLFVPGLSGRDQIVAFTESHVVGHAPDDGAVLWRFPWPAETQKVAPPLALGGDRLLVSSGYGVGSKLLALGPDVAGAIAPSLVWESPHLKAKLSNFVERDGTVYGLDDGILVALALRDGSRLWKRGRYGHGQMLLVGDLLLLQAESGDVVLVEALASGPRELGRLDALGDKTWNHPALAGPFLLVRNDREAACYRLPRAAPRS